MKHDPIEFLLVDDNDDDVELLRDAFEQAGVRNPLHVARDGVEALAYLRRQGTFAHATRPGMVLMDINMPKMNGLEALDEIKADPELRAIPVVMLTTSSRDEDILRAYESGACSYVRKPVEMEGFRQVVRHFHLYWTVVSELPCGGDSEDPAHRR